MNRTRPKQIVIRVSEEELAQIKKKVEQSGKSQQQYIIEALTQKQVINTDGIKEILSGAEAAGKQPEPDRQERSSENGYVDYKHELPDTMKERERSMAVIKAVSSKAGIGQVLDYVTKGEKTEEKAGKRYCNCEPETVKDEMQATKELWGKTGGRTYKHFVQSYHADEQITPEQAHRNAVELAEHTQAWQGFEVLIVTHKDRKHIHTTFLSSIP